MIVSSIISKYNDFVINKKINKVLSDIIQLLSFYEQFSNLEIQTKFAEYQQKVLDYKTLSGAEYDVNANIFAEAMAHVIAMVCVASHRMRNEMPFHTQIRGAIALCYLRAIELSTGQGKTLTAVLSAIYRCLWTKKLHIVTANDYLAYRDYVEMGPLYSFFGIAIGYIVRSLNNSLKIVHYRKQVVYISNHEIGFDYLKSNMQHRLEDILINLDDFQHVIIDEMDLILIDNARIPVIISSTQNNNELFYYTNAYKIVNQFELDDVEINYKEKNVFIKPNAIERLEVLISQHFNISITELYSNDNIDIFFYIDRCLRAKFLFECNREYIVQDSSVVVVDEYTGRVAKDRKFSAGIHQSLEAKENLTITAEGISTNYITTQNIYRKYRFISGMTGTIITDKQEIEIIYNTRVLKINSQNPNMKYRPDLFFITKHDKYTAMAKKVKQLQDKRQPVLIGTSNIQESEEIAKYLVQTSVKFSILNAKCLDTEAKIISDAGMPGQVTIATNLAGRGTDIKLGGNAKQKLDSMVEEFNKQNMVQGSDTDLQLREQQLNDAKATIVNTYKRNKELALQNGGLYVIISQKQENRRIEQQFRGRSGRINDPGETQTFVALEDEIFKVNKINVGILEPLLQNRQAGCSSVILSHLTSRLQKQHEKSMFYARINVMNQDYTLSHGRDVFFELRYSVISRKTSPVKVAFSVLESFIFDIENLDRRDILYKYAILINAISAEQDISVIYDIVRKILHNKDKIVLFLYNMESKLVNSYLQALDHRWSVFINSKEAKKRIITLQSNLDYILDYNYYIHKLFIEILSVHEIELTKIVYQEINRYFLNIN